MRCSSWPARTRRRSASRTWRSWERASEKNRRLADLVLLAAWTGLRWSELRAIRVPDFLEFAGADVDLQRVEFRGRCPNGTKSGKTRRVPVADRVLPIVRELWEAGSRTPCCASQKRHKLHATALKRTLGWAKIADRRRIHGLRHIAACLGWLAASTTAFTMNLVTGHYECSTLPIYRHTTDHD